VSDGKKKFKDTKVGKFLNGAAPHILGDVANEVPGVGLIKTIAKVVAGDPGMTADQKMEFARLAAEEEQNAQEQVTRRWEADAKADVKLAKFIRPVMLITLTVFYMTLTIWDGASPRFMPPENYINLLEVLMLTAFGAYFAGRTVEKIRK
jgi:hypothetical protein